MTGREQSDAGCFRGEIIVIEDRELLPEEIQQSAGIPSALETLEPVILKLLSSLRETAAATEAVMLFGDPANVEKILFLVEADSTTGRIESGRDVELPTWSNFRNDFPGEGPVRVELPETYSSLWSSAGLTKPVVALWIPLKIDNRFLGAILLSGGPGGETIPAADSVEVRTAADHMAGLLGQVIRLERENEKLVQLISMLQVTRTLMRESEAGHLVNQILNTLSRIVGNNKLALFPTTVLGESRTFIRHIDAKDGSTLHDLLIRHLKPRQDDGVQGRRPCTDVSELFPEIEFSSFSRMTPWVLRDAGRTYLGMLYMFDNDPAQEDTLSHTVIRTIVVELERTLRRYLLEDDAAHAIIELPYRIWSREYWLRRFEEEIGLTGRRGTRVSCGIIELVNYEQLREELDDLVLKESILTLIQVIKASVRETDLVCRLDRNHFGILFLDAAKVKVLPAIERISKRLKREVWGTSMSHQINFVAGLAEFPWDGEGVPTLLRRAWTASAIARSRGPFSMELYEHEGAQLFLSNNTDVREEITVHMELLGSLELTRGTSALRRQTAGES